MYSGDISPLPSVQRELGIGSSRRGWYGADVTMNELVSMDDPNRNPMTETSRVDAGGLVVSYEH